MVLLDSSPRQTDRGGHLLFYQPAPPLLFFWSEYFLWWRSYRSSDSKHMTCSSLPASGVTSHVAQAGLIRASHSSGSVIGQWGGNLTRRRVKMHLGGFSNRSWDGRQGVTSFFPSMANTCNCEL